MPNNLPAEGKLYYSISEVAEMFQVNASLIRFWEKEFSILKPRKTASGNRKFTKEDIETLRLIYHLVKERRFTLEGAKAKIRNNRSGEESTMEVIHKLQALRSELLQWKERLNDNQ